MNWETFIVYQFLQDCIEAQENNVDFHYAGLLILITLVRWQEHAYYQQMKASCQNPLATRYVNLWNSTIKSR
jgi:hypothetical protein